MHHDALKTTLGASALAAYVATMPAANLMTAHLGGTPVGFGLFAPAGVFAFGAALILRDFLHAAAGGAAVLAAIAAGTALSYLVAPPSLAAASAAAFLLAELADTAVYTPLRNRGLLPAVAASTAVGIAVDSALFAYLAFGSLDALPGLLLAKAYLTAAALALLAAARPLMTKPEARP